MSPQYLRKRLAVALGLALGLTLAPVVGHAAEPERQFQDKEKDLPPAGTRTKVLAAGALFTGVFYGGAIGASYLWETDPGASDLRIPIVGPWMKVGHTTLCTEAQKETGCNDVLQVFGAVLAGVSGLGQVAGVALLTEGIFLHQSSSKKTASGYRVGGTWYGARGGRELAPSYLFDFGNVQMSPVPLSDGSTFAGLGVVGRFR